MAEVSETELPGLGIRYELATREGRHLGVLVHRGGRREVFVYREDDPDACAATMRLDEDEAHTLSELLGGSRITEHLGALHQSVEGLAIDWIVVEDGAPWAGLTLREAAVHTVSGVAVVALLRAGQTTVAPGPTDRLLAGDTVVAVGSDEGMVIARASFRRADA
jgi:TrkA domain protein